MANQNHSPAPQKTAPSQQFYERALAHYNDRLGPIAQRLRVQQYLLLGMSVALVVALSFSAYMGYLVATRPVEVVKIMVGNGGAEQVGHQLVGVSSGSSERDRQMVEKTLSDYIRGLKTVSADADLMIASITRAQVMSAASVVGYVKGYFQVEARGPNSPFELAAKYRVAVEFKAVQPITGTTYRVDWVETYLDAQRGVAVKTERWSSTVTFKLLPPAEVPAAMNRIDNPLALLVTALEWSKDRE